MDNGVIIAISGSTIAIVGVVIAMMFWCRQESNGTKETQKDDRKDLLQAFRGLEMAIHEIKIENKDFHYRLLEIERARSGGWTTKN